MERGLLVNADDFGLSKGQNYGLVEAYRNGVVTSTTAPVKGEAIDPASQLSREMPALGLGLHFRVMFVQTCSCMPCLTS
ncbi:ChbG/HpnK family deacetylase, partial [Salmonella enterica]|uniref:ChbG/HpnK family deacetylase n=1 Tax=Salmonella enterica TaxID=28901 RepID=UPI00398C70DD